MLPIRMIEKYADWQAWLHDYIVGQRALKLHAFILKEFKLEPILAEKKPRSVLDVGCGGGQAVIRLKELYPHLDLTGIDLTESQISRAEIRAKRKRCQVQFDVADAEIVALGEGEIEAGDRRGRPHGEALRQPDSGRSLRVKQRE